MKKILKIIGVILGLGIPIGLFFFFKPVDIRPDYLQNQITESDIEKGKALLSDMQTAYGGMNNWLAQKTGSYSQVADWYDDKMGISGWDALPQQFQMTSTLGTDNCEFTLLNGANTGQTWGVKNWATYQLKNGEKEFIPNEKYHHKLIYKNYWFQFPFRISEAPIIAFAGESTVKGETYDLLYATWGTDDANREYDQYVLYISKETKMVEWLHFTLREKVKFIHITANFTDFKTINGIHAPFTQYITIGNPESEGRKMHENRYQWVQFGEEKVMR